MHPGDKEFAVAKRTKRIGQVGFPGTDRFYLGAGKLDAGNELFEEFIIVRRPPVFDDDIAIIISHRRYQANIEK